MRIARVFPRQTRGTPKDALAFVGPPPICPDSWPEVDQVHISVTFTGDLKEVRALSEAWGRVAPVKIHGPAYDHPGGEFVPGLYLKEGYTITSRGCPHRCWFCDVWKRSGDLRELPIRDGWIVQDDNLLACSRPHIEAVIDMLHRQKLDHHNVGLMGMDAALLKDWHVELLWGLKPTQMFFAYDRPEELEPLVEAGKLLRYADFTRSHLRCYVLVGHPKDTMSCAFVRLLDAWEAGFLPFSMLYMDKDGRQDPAWANFMRTWSRPPATKSEVRRLFGKRMRCLPTEGRGQ